MTDHQTTNDIALATLAEMTHDPVAVRSFADDLQALRAYREARVIATDAGQSAPEVPKPSSRYLQLLVHAVKMRLRGVAELFTSDELDRLKKIGPALALGLERNDADLADEVYRLVLMEPQDAANWVREHLEEIEARFAS